jgi:hypothetical protein
MAPMTAEQLRQHPEYNHTIWDLKPSQKGKFPVAKDRGGPINIAYEVHGTGDRHLVVSLPNSIFGPHTLQRPMSKTGTQCSTICHTHPLASLCLDFAPPSAVWPLLHVLFQSHGPSHNTPPRLMFLNLQSLSHVFSRNFRRLAYFVFPRTIMPRTFSCCGVVLIPCSGSWALVG